MKLEVVALSLIVTTRTHLNILNIGLWHITVSLSLNRDVPAWLVLKGNFQYLEYLHDICTFPNFTIQYIRYRIFSIVQFRLRYKVKTTKTLIWIVNKLLGVVGTSPAGATSTILSILDLTPSCNELDKDNCKTSWVTFRFGDLVRLILELFDGMYSFIMFAIGMTASHHTLWFVGEERVFFC